MSLGPAERVPSGGTKRTALVALLLCGVAFLAAQVVDSVPAAVEPLVFADSAVAACDFSGPVSLRRADGTEQMDLASIRLNSNTYLLAQLCAPTLIRLTAEGMAVDGVGARLAIHLGDTQLFNDVITGIVDLELQAPSPGGLLIAFTNDLYRPPLDRNLWLKDVEFIPLMRGGSAGDSAGVQHHTWSGAMGSGAPRDAAGSSETQARSKARRQMPGA